MTGRGSHEFDVVSTRDIHIGRVVALRLDEVRMPGGSTAAREIVEHFGAVAVAALDEHDNLVMIHQYRHAMARRLWELPAGLLDIEGESPVDTARRELAEEVGLAARRWEVLVDVAASPGFTDEIVRVFLARELSEVPSGIGDGDEEDDLVVHRIPLPEAARMALAGEIVNGTAVAGVLAAHAVVHGDGTARPVDAPWRDRPHRFPARKRDG